MFKLMTHEVGHQKNGCGKKKKNVRKLVGSAMAKVTEFTAEHQRRHPEQRAENARRKHRSRSKLHPGRRSTATHRFSRRARISGSVCMSEMWWENSENLGCGDQRRSTQVRPLSASVRRLEKDAHPKAERRGGYTVPEGPCRHSHPPIYRQDRQKIPRRALASPTDFGATQPKAKCHTTSAPGKRTSRTILNE